MMYYKVCPIASNSLSVFLFLGPATRPHHPLSPGHGKRLGWSIAVAVRWTTMRRWKLGEAVVDGCWEHQNKIREASEGSSNGNHRNWFRSF